MRRVPAEFPMPEAFTVRTEVHGGAAVVVPTGELDLATAPALEDALQSGFDSDAARVVLDLRELEFIDSSGLRTLLTARRNAEAASKQFSLVAGHRGLERTLEIAGVHKVFDWTPAEELA
jgi:anti-anti-sigma factor